MFCKFMSLICLLGCNQSDSLVGPDQSYIFFFLSLSNDQSYVMALLSEGYKIEASSNMAADLSPSSILEAQTSDAKIQIKALFSQLLSLTQQVVGADSIQAKDAELATQKEAIKCKFFLFNN